MEILKLYKLTILLTIILIFIFFIAADFFAAIFSLFLFYVIVFSPRLISNFIKKIKRKRDKVCLCELYYNVNDFDDKILNFLFEFNYIRLITKKDGSVILLDMETFNNFSKNSDEIFIYKINNKLFFAA